jgi:G3E family GTPase
MSEMHGADTELMSVSIIAGPLADALLGKLDLARDRGVGLLTSGSSPASTQLTVIQQPSGSSPDQIIARIASVAEQRAVNELIIQCEAERPPMAYASLFAATSPSHSGLAKVAELTATTFAIEATTFLDTILARGPNAIPAVFMAEQIEFVDEIIFDNSSDFDLARSIALALNPSAQVTRLSDAAATWGKSHSAGAFDFNASLERAGWRRLLDDDEEGVASNSRVIAIGYSARRPFHPERFSNFLQQTSQTIFRAKGFFWLASRMDEVGGLNLAGSDLHCSSAGSWLATRDAHSRETEMPEHARKQWTEPFGDRRQTFGIMALDTDRTTLQTALDRCLLSDAEMNQGPEEWRNFPDPFPSWSHQHAHSHSHAHDHDHDGECDHHHHHDSDEHGCCHH